MRKLLFSMPIEIMQKCSRRAGEYKPSCLELVKEDNCNLKFNDIENMKKELKGKRCILDKDHSVVK